MKTNNCNKLKRLGIMLVLKKTDQGVYVRNIMTGLEVQFENHQCAFNALKKWGYK